MSWLSGHEAGAFNATAASQHTMHVGAVFHGIVLRAVGLDQRSGGDDEKRMHGGLI